MAGLIVWHELYTSDVDAASRFYAELLGAEIETMPTPDFEYRMLKKDDDTHAGFVPKAAEHSEVPSHWYPYVQVDDVDAAVETATSLGSTVHWGPVDMENLRFAVLGDPQHASFGVITGAEQPKPMFAWDELHAADVDAAAQYYGRIAGWTAAEFMEGYRIFNAGETGVAGLMPKSEDMPVAFWMSYFAVADTDAATAKAQELGATLLMEPTSMENVGRFSVLNDPTGAAFGLHQAPAEG